MRVSDLISICKAYNSMGWAVTEQLEDVVNGASLEEQNSNALGMIKEFLSEVMDYFPEDEELQEDLGELLVDIDKYLQGEDEDEEYPRDTPMGKDDDNPVDY